MDTADMIEREERSTAQDAPPISAIFLVVFDQKIGYSIAYKRAIAGVDLEGVVEYKSLPSGLHNVESDLVYFIHDQHAGISAFVSRPAAETDRNAHYVTVGVLVPLTYGLLGRSWTHAAALRELARTTVEDVNDTSALEHYWDTHRIDHSEEQSQNAQGDTGHSHQSAGRRRKTRAPSDAATLGRSGHALSSDHPAMSLPRQLESFGPLLFPLYRAALLRKRILILTQVPVLEACNLVYNISVLSNVPSHVADVIPMSDAGRIRPLFNVGVHDITYLTELSSRDDSSEVQKESGSNGSYIACSTDEILATKRNIYDVLVEFPHEVDSKEGAKQWPTLRSSGGEQIKATQRDLRRYRALKKELQRFENSRQDAYHDEDEGQDEDNDEDESETAPLTHITRSIWEGGNEDTPLDGEAELVEATTWTAIAYTGFLWWASAGEKETWLEDEVSQDASLLTDLPIPESSQSSSARRSRNGNGKRASNGTELISEEEDGSRIEGQAKAMLIIAFAHRLTTMVLENMAELTESTDDVRADEGSEKAVSIESEDLRSMGLDVWSEADKEFARDMVQLYFRKEAEVRGQGVECCGMKIC